MTTHVPDPAAGNSTVMAAVNKALTELYTRLNAAERAARWRKIQVSVLAIITAILIVVSGITIYGFYENQQTALNVQNGAITECLSGNASRSVNVQVWDTFISLILKGNKDPIAQEEGQTFKQFVAAQFGPRDCYAIYHVRPPAPH